MERYMTRGINENISIFTQQVMWALLEHVDAELDYLQIFNLRTDSKGLTIINHHQEQPKFSQVIYVPNVIVTKETKVYVILEDDYATMMLAEEY